MEKDQSYLLRKNQWQKSFLIKASTFFLLITGFTTSYAQKLQVVTTTTMISDAVEQVGGNRVHVNGLMGPGVDPHLYKPAASDVIKLSRADIVFYNGLALEGKMADLFTRLSLQGKPIYAVTRNISKSKLLKPEGVNGHWDPHVWGDPGLWIECVALIAEGLIKSDPDGQTTYDKGKNDYTEKLKSLKVWGVKNVNKIPSNNRYLITSHDAFNYFGKAFGFQVVGVQGISTVAEAPLADIIHIVDFIKSKKIPAIFVESSVSPATIKRISQDSGARIGGELFSDALGTNGELNTFDALQYDLGTYEGWIAHNISKVVTALK
jgi:manganese/zinc/iron transport system substrate-binding protein